MGGRWGRNLCSHPSSGQARAVPWLWCGSMWVQVSPGCPAGTWLGLLRAPGLLHVPSEGRPAPSVALQQFGVPSWDHHNLPEPLLIHLQACGCCWSSSDPAGKGSNRGSPPWEKLNIDQSSMVDSMALCRTLGRDKDLVGTELQCHPGTALGVGKRFGFSSGCIPWMFKILETWWCLCGAGRAGSIKIPCII